MVGGIHVVRREYVAIDRPWYRCSCGEWFLRGAAEAHIQQAWGRPVSSECRRIAFHGDWRGARWLTFERPQGWPPPDPAERHDIAWHWTRWISFERRPR